MAMGMINTVAGTVSKVLADLTTHISIWTNGLATKLNNNVNATVSSRAAQTTADNIYARTDTTTSSRMPTFHSVQTGYVKDVAMSTGTGQDACYYDVTVTSIPSTTRVLVDVVGSIGSSAAGPISGSTAFYPVIGRMTSTTNLRIHYSTQPSSPTLECCWKITAFN